MLRVIIITICAVLDIWLLHQIWVAEKQLLWTLLILLFHVITVAVYIFLDTTGNNNDKNNDDEGTTIYM